MSSHNIKKHSNVLAHKIVFLLMNTHVMSSDIYLMRNNRLSTSTICLKHYKLGVTFIQTDFDFRKYSNYTIFQLLPLARLMDC